MNPLDIHLKFPDQATATALLLDAGVWLESIDDEGNVRYYNAPNYLTDVIGLIYKPTGAKLLSEDGLEMDEMADIGGWHVNMRGQLPVKFQQYKVIITGIPHRIWD
jgi:hypothetical protein